MHETSQLALGAAAVGLAGTWAWRQRLALRAVHRASAIALASFLAAHLLGHLAGLAGAAAHQSVLEALRLIYRQPLVEGVLLGCLLFQMGSGLTLLWRGRGRRRGGVAWMRTAPVPSRWHCSWRPTCWATWRGWPERQRTNPCWKPCA